MNYRENYNRWLAEKSVSEELKAELRAIANNEDEIKYRFSDYLSFGTAGLRGKMLAGTNAMNVHTVAHASQGFANLINQVNSIIGYFVKGGDASGCTGSCSTCGGCH